MQGVGVNLFKNQLFSRLLFKLPELLRTSATALVARFYFNKLKGKERMKGILRSFKLKELETKTEPKKKFKLLEFKVDVKVNDKGDIKTLTGDMSEDYARKYFNYCNVKTSEIVGKEVGVVTAKRSYTKDGDERTITYIKYLNVLDEDGEPIIMNNNSSIDF